MRLTESRAATWTFVKRAFIVVSRRAYQPSMEFVRLFYVETWPPFSVAYWVNPKSSQLSNNH